MVGWERSEQRTPESDFGEEERIELREYLSLTVSVDHDLIDGAPAARFAEHLKELIEDGVSRIEQ